MDSSGGRVLVVDDEPAVRKLVKMYLERSGFVVVDGASGEDALELFNRGDSGVKLLITDVMMPGMSGCDLAARIRRMRPSLPILFMSGYCDGVPGLREDMRCFPKPLDLSRLADAVGKMLRSNDQSATPDLVTA
jgi:DNA-binding response OmpR family regulator